MSENEEEEVAEKPFHVDRAKSARAGCKKCKQKIGKDELRFGKLGYNPFGSGTMKMWHHIPCIFEVFKRQRAATRKIECPDDIAGWEDIDEEDRQEIMNYFTPELRKVFESQKNKKTPDPSPKKGAEPPSKKAKVNKELDNAPSKPSTSDGKEYKDDTFRAFRKLCLAVANESSHIGKTNIIRELFTKGSDGDSFKGDVEQWCRLLLPGVIKKVYNLQSKQLVKIFSRILQTDQDEMLEDLEKGDVAETIGTFFEKSSAHKPSSKAVLSIQDVDSFLEYLSKLTREEDQMNHFTKVLKKCTSNDLKMILRLVKHDLRINAGAKPVLEALHEDAYSAFQTSRDIHAVVKNALKASSSKKTVSKQKGMKIGMSLMTPVLPMLAQACKSVEMALKKCPNGMYSEIKYDGERVQVHKQKNNFKYFSRSLKLVLDHKVKHFKDFIPEAFPYGEDLVLDAEVLMVDTATGKPLPFGTLGKHKKAEFQDASVCLFVFDCIYYNGESLINKPLCERKKILNDNMKEIQNHIMFSEMEEVHKAEDLEAMITKVFRLGLEGLVLKDIKSSYEPGKRHWLKVKKDYLFGGAMADSADLVVLGAWFGTGNKGGIMSSFLMGCLDSVKDRWVTVTKVHGGHDDNTLDRLQKELNVVKISKDITKVPKWLKCTKTMVPDFVAKNPKSMPVWEITGAEFTCNQVHTADGISVRFPRVTKIRSDKDWKTATNLLELKALYKESKVTSDFSLNVHKTESKESKEDSPIKDKNNGNAKKKIKLQEDVASHSKQKDDDSATETETEEDEPTRGSIAITNPLYDVFINTILDMPQDYKDTEFLRRYIIAYGGVLYDETKNTTVENSTGTITHVVYSRKDQKRTLRSTWTGEEQHVYVNWVWDSIKLLERQGEAKYLIKR